MSIKIKLQNCIRFIYELLIRPGGSPGTATEHNEDEVRREFILNCILTGLITLLGFLDIFIFVRTIILGNEYHGVPFPIFTLIVIFFLILLILSRKGYFHISAYSMIAVFFFGATFGIYHWGFDLHIAILSYVLIIIMASIVVSNRFGFIVTIIIGVTSITISQLQLHDIIHPQLYWKQRSGAQQPLEFFIIYLFVMAVSWLSNHETVKALHRARRSEKALEEKNESLERTVEERTRELKQSQIEKLSQMYRFVEFGKLSSGIFHDLMNPLSVVSANVKELGSVVHSDIPEIRKNLDEAIKASRRMEQFMETVRKQIRTQDTKTIFLANEEVEQALNLFNYKSRKANIVISFIAREQIHIFGNSLRFHQIISNLISNALDAYENYLVIDERRIITVKIDKRKGKGPNRDLVRIKVTDRACGIPRNVVDKIFDPFFTTKSQYRGMGLGLSTTKDIVEKNFHGTIRIESREGEGTTFIIHIPTNVHNNTHEHLTTGATGSPRDSQPEEHPESN